MAEKIPPDGPLYYNSEALRRFFDDPDGMDRASAAVRYLAGVRLIAEVFRQMRAHYPAAATVLDACEVARHPLTALLSDATWGVHARHLMTDLGLLLSIPPGLLDDC